MISSVSVANDHLSISTITGVAPTFLFVTSCSGMETVITSSLSFVTAFKLISNASVPFATPTAYLVPIKLEKFFQRTLLLCPICNC